MELPEWVVIVEQQIRIGPKSKDESKPVDVERRFYVRARTAGAAQRSVESAGITGKIIDVFKVTSQL